MSDLQRNIGNRAVLSVLAAGQDALEVGAADDPTEREADTLARKVVTGLARTSPGSPSGPPDTKGQPGLAVGLTRTVHHRDGARRSIQSIQRRLSVTKKEIEHLNTKVGIIRSAIGSDTTWGELVHHMEDYDKAVNSKKARPQLGSLFALEMLATEWLDRHESSNSSSDKDKAALMRRLLAECDTEISSLQGALDSIYEDRLIDTNIRLGADSPTDARYQRRRRKKNDLSFGFITASAASKKPGSNDPAGTHIDQFGPMRSQPDVAPYGLTDAELAAIRVYSGGDYKMINPTLQRSDPWLHSNVTNLANKVETHFAHADTKAGMEKSGGKLDTEQRRTMKIDAMMHARLAISGLKKLPDISDETYRGLTMSLEELIVDYKPKRRIVYKPFISTSTDKGMAEGYARIPQAGKVPVLVTNHVTKGKDIKKISVAAKEGEVLLMPGAEFEVTEAPKFEGGLYRTTLTQVAQGGVLTGPPAPAVPLQNLAPNQQIPPPSNLIGQRQRGGAAPPVPPALLNKKATECAKVLIGKAKSAEPAITAFLAQLCQREKGCQLAGTEHKFKTEGSLARKLAAKATTRVTTKNLPLDKALAEEAETANDVLRYTMIAPRDTYREIEQRVREALQTKYKLINNWDAWRDPNAKTYKGLNMGFRAGDVVFEFQMHTKESFDTKQVIHAEYEEAREAGTSPERKKALENYMTAKWEGVASPEQKGGK